jgi:hypothetical protein
MPQKMYRLVLGTVCLSLLIISVSANKSLKSENKPVKSAGPALGIEIALEKRFYIPAGTATKKMAAVIKVPLSANLKSQSISAVKLVPLMDDGKVKVTVFLLKGDPTNIISCKELDQLKATKIDTFVVGLNKEVAITKLRKYGVNFEKGDLKFRVVLKKVFPDLGGLGEEGCGCATCGGLLCCPNPGKCINCGSCGLACCIPE